MHWSSKTANITKRDKYMSHNGRTQPHVWISLPTIESESDQISREANFQEIQKTEPVCIQQNSDSGQFYITNSLISLINKLQGKKKECERTRGQLTEQKIFWEN